MSARPSARAKKRSLRRYSSGSLRVTSAPAGVAVQSCSRVSRKRSAAPRQSTGSAARSASESGPQRGVGGEHRVRLGHVERAVRLEAPGVQAHREVVGQQVGAGEVEVDQAGDARPAAPRPAGRRRCRGRGRRGCARSGSAPGAGQSRRMAASAASSSAMRPGCTPSPSRAAAVEQRRPAGRAERVGPRRLEALGPRRCSRASAAPSGAQCSGRTRRGQTPARKVQIAAGRPASSRSACAVPRLHRQRAGQACARARCSISPRNQGSSPGSTRFS